MVAKNRTILLFKVSPTLNKFLWMLAAFARASQGIFLKR